MEDQFNFLYHLHLPPTQSMCLPVYERKWLLNRFVEQKEKEHQAMESAKKRGKSK